MKFICLAYYDKAMDSHPREEVDALLRECSDHVDELHASGQILVDAALGTDMATICTRNGKRIVSDSSPNQLNEQVGGVFMIEAQDLPAAIQLASRHPAALMGEQYGWRLEIRPVHTIKLGGQPWQVDRNVRKDR